MAYPCSLNQRRKRGGRKRLPAYFAISALEVEQKYYPTLQLSSDPRLGVLICPSHEVFLEQSRARIKYARNQSDFFTATQSIPKLSARTLDGADPDHKTFLELARGSSWLLCARQPATALSGLQNRYLRLLIPLGLATYSGGIQAHKLLNQFLSHYSTGLLKTLCCELGGRDVYKDNWLLRLVRGTKHAHPIEEAMSMLESRSSRSHAGRGTS